MDTDLMAILDHYRNLHSMIHAEMAKAVLGQTQLIDEVLMALFCNAHVLLTAPRNLTLFTLSRVLGLSINRIQHTDDLLPEDITGSQVLCQDAVGGQFSKTYLGPIFANMVLADCFDCAPPVTQSVLLEAMQARQVQVGQQTLPLKQPFLVMVMENPPGGQFPLDESHRGRFMFNACFTIPSEADFLANMQLHYHEASGFPPLIETVLSKADLEQIQMLVRRMPVPQQVVDYTLRLVRLTRPGQQYTPAFVQDTVNWGVGPRGAQFLLTGAKAHAVLHGQPHVSIGDVRAVAPAVLRHRIVLKASAKDQGLDGNQIVAVLLKLARSDDHEVM
ncbi:MAG: MoxR family ATPase [Zavarzinella sp.]